MVRSFSRARRFQQLYPHLSQIFVQDYVQDKDEYTLSRVEYDEEPSYPDSVVSIDDEEKSEYPGDA